MFISIALETQFFSLSPFRVSVITIDIIVPHAEIKEGWIMNESKILKRIDELIALCDQGRGEPFTTIASEIYIGTITVIEQIYGATSAQMTEAKAEKQRIGSIRGMNFDESTKSGMLVQALKGMLSSFRSDVENGLVGRIEEEARGEIYSSFLALAKESLDNDGKDAAAVLVAAALEDALKKLVASHGEEMDGAEMTAVIDKLKSMSLVKKPEAKTLQSYVTFRNKALHAEWDKIGEIQIASAIGFLERFILVHFSGGRFGERNFGIHRIAAMARIS